MHGLGLMRFPDGTVEEGMWIKGERQEKNKGDDYLHE